MHGMLSLAGLVAAFAGLMGWAGYLLVRLYRACPAPRSSLTQPAAGHPAASSAADDPAEPPPAGDPADSSPVDDLAGPPPPGDPAAPTLVDDGDPAGEQAATPQPVA